jgi:cystathionine beta-lyase/cystathionine gamma-synthase
MELSFILNHLGEDRESYFNAVSPPIYQTSNFIFSTVEEMRNRFKDEMGGYLYSRGLNPTVDILRKKLAALDGAEDALVFNSGASAIFASVVPFVEQGDHIISVKNPYTWAQKLFNDFLPKFGVFTTYVDGRDVQNFIQESKSNTKIIYLESPNSWDFAIQNLREIAAWAKSKNIMTVVDNSYSSPLYQKPIEMGIDLVLQSVTKYLNGHSDVVAGVLTGSHARMKKIFNLEYLTVGNGIQPFNAWLVLRGLRTLPIRMERITNTTVQVMKFLKTHSAVEKVIFPWDDEFPQYDLARSQMTGACGLLSFVVKTTSLVQIEKFCESLQSILMAVSWGGHESLIIPRAAGMNRDDFDGKNEEHRMIRLYVGLEDSEYIIHDLDNAFRQIT